MSFLFLNLKFGTQIREIGKIEKINLNAKHYFLNEELSASRTDKKDYWYLL
jgi:hypothetical protein